MTELNSVEVEMVSGGSHNSDQIGEAIIAGGILTLDPLIIGLGLIWFAVP